MTNKIDVFLICRKCATAHPASRDKLDQAKEHFCCSNCGSTDPPVVQEYAAVSRPFQ